MKRLDTRRPHPQERAGEPWPTRALDAARFGAFDYEPASRRLRSTERYRELFGLAAVSEPSLEEVLSRIHPEDRHGLLSQWDRAVSERTRSDVDYRVAAGDDSWRWLCSVGEAAEGSDGLIHFVGLTMEVTERRSREEAFREADRRKDEFLATLSHELRAPLAPILHSLEIIDRAEAQSEVSARARAMIRRQVRHMERLVDDLFDVTRIREGKLQLRPTRLDLAALLRDAVESGRGDMERRGQMLTLDTAERIHVDADPTRLAQVFGNLLSNASRYTPRGGSIRVVARRTEESAVVSVSDTGAGIPLEMLPKVFDMFAQLESSGAGAGGLGVGLTLVKKLVELHRGEVAVESEGPGRGSTFTVTLPLALERRTSPRPLHVSRPASAVRIPPRRRRVLVVDDNRDGAESLTELLRLTGHDAVATFDGPAAVNRARTYKPQIVLLDIGLPEMSGYEICRQLRAQPGGRDVAIVAVTGWGQDADRQRTRDAGFSDHIVKPVSYAELLELLARLPAEESSAV